MTKNKTIQWENFSINSPEFIKAKQKDSLSQLLHHYFTLNKIANDQFVIDLAANYPEVLLRAIRVNRAFLRSEHIPSLQFLKDSKNKKLSDHFRFFTKLSKYEKEFFDQFQNDLSECQRLDILTVLCWINFWFEEKRALLFESQSAHIQSYDIHPFVETIDFFLSHYLFANKEKIKNTIFEREQDIEALMPAMIELRSVQNYKTHKVWRALDSAHTYYQFLKTTIEIYSFDSNYDITIENNTAILKYLDESKLKRWLIESVKLNCWYAYYRTLATELVHSEMEKIPDLIKNISGIDYEMNYEGAIRNTISRIIASEFSLLQSNLSDVPTASILQTLSGLVNNAWGRYVAPMDKLNYANPSSWIKNIGINCVTHGRIAKDDGNRLSAFPSRFTDTETILNIIGSTLEDAAGYSEKLIDLMSFDIDKISYLDRLRPVVNLTGKPLIKLNNFYYAFNGILGETSSQVHTLINIMDSNTKDHSKVTKSETEQMETYVRELFKKAGFDSVDGGIEYSLNQNTVGDFDILVYEKGILLLIELKRSKVRLHLSDAHDEYENSLLKASGQLSKAQEHIASDFTRCKTEYFKNLRLNENNFSDITLYPMIVSTSFEHDHTTINNKHFKISLFELQNVLKMNIEPVNGNKLEGLVMKLLRNDYWRTIENAFVMPDLENYILRMDL